MKKCNLIVGAVVSAGLVFALPIQASQKMAENVDLKTLPTAAQKTIKEKSAGGQVVRVDREDDKDGKWRYEVVVKTNGKEWGFEVDPNGKFVRKHENHLAAR